MRESRSLTVPAKRHTIFGWRGDPASYDEADPAPLAVDERR
jgi:hypothetical protein